MDSRAQEWRSVAGLVTIDVEPDNVWADTHSRGMENIAALPGFHELCGRFGVRPTYLVTYSVAENADTARVLERLLARGDCEIGAHPHLWETPPFVARDTDGTAWTGAAYDSDVLMEKLGNLHALLARRFGAPSSHRSGRYGLDPRQVQMLSNLGLTIDTSVTPGMNWSMTGAPDYTDAPPEPYFLAKSDLTRPGDSDVLEVPCTIQPGRGWAGLQKISHVKAMAQRFGLGPRWLRVSPASTASTLTRICAWAASQRLHQNVMTHSSELHPSTSPYWRMGSDVNRHYALYAALFQWWNDHAIPAKTLAEFGAGFTPRMRGVSGGAPLAN